MQYEENKAPAERHHHRHGRAWPGHPRLWCRKKARRGCPGTSPGMTKTVLIGETKRPRSKPGP